MQPSLVPPPAGYAVRGISIFEGCVSSVDAELNSTPRPALFMANAWKTCVESFLQTAVLWNRLKQDEDILASFEAWECSSSGFSPADQTNRAMYVTLEKMIHKSNEEASRTSPVAIVVDYTL